jgi:tRNA(fMet)-specific endonuclease VapC
VAAEYLLDTNILIAALNGTSSPLLNRLAGFAPSRLQLSPVVLGELLLGAEKSQRREAALSAVQELAESMAALPFDADDARSYAHIRAALERKGNPIGSLDMLIAAQAVARELVLVTDNLREFKRVPGLVCENWLR